MQASAPTSPGRLLQAADRAPQASKSSCCKGFSTSSPGRDVLAASPCFGNGSLQCNPRYQLTLQLCSATQGPEESPSTFIPPLLQVHVASWRSHLCLKEQSPSPLLTGHIS